MGQFLVRAKSVNAVRKALGRAPGVCVSWAGSIAKRSSARTRWRRTASHATGRSS